MKILTVFRSGGEYRVEHVERLRKQCAEYAPGVEFRCVSNIAALGGFLLLHDWPGWWSKIEAFRIDGPCLYMDLDTTVCGDLAPLLDIAARHEFVTLRDFNYPARVVQSSIMAWSGDMRWIYENFRHSPCEHMAANASPRWWGDQGYIERVASPEFWQDLKPGALVSWKKHCGDGVPNGARAVVFHGRPRPWEV